MKKFLFGALIGAGVALLYAPATGRRTRSLIRDKSKKLANDASDMIEAKSQHLKNKFEGIKAQARNIADKVKDALPTTDTAMDHSDAVDHLDHMDHGRRNRREPVMSSMDPSI